VVVGDRTVAMLEDLDADHERVGRALWERAQVAMDQAVAPVRRPRSKLGERSRRNVEAEQIELAADERQVVTPVAAADIEPFSAEQIVLLGGGQDVGDERQGRLIAVTTGRVFDIPGLPRLTPLIRSTRHLFIVPGASDGSRECRG
jgi:hypothetical protein